MDLSRQMGLIKPDILETAERITCIGVGGIGTPTVLTLAKMGAPGFHLMDDDVVAPHNIPNQLFRLSDIGRPKVDATKEVIESFTGAKVTTAQERFDGSQKLEGIVISAVDSMDARKVIWEKVRYNIHIPLYLEARMGAEVMRIYALNPTDPDAVAAYEATLYSSSEAVQAPCTQKSISYTVMIVGGLIASQVKKWLVGEPVKQCITFDLKTLWFEAD